MGYRWLVNGPPGRMIEICRNLRSEDALPLVEGHACLKYDDGSLVGVYEIDCDYPYDDRARLWEDVQCKNDARNRLDVLLAEKLSYILTINRVVHRAQDK